MSNQASNQNGQDDGGDNEEYLNIGRCPEPRSYLRKYCTITILESDLNDDLSVNELSLTVLSCMDVLPEFGKDERTLPPTAQLPRPQFTSSMIPPIIPAFLLPLLAPPETIVLPATTDIPDQLEGADIDHKSA
ncbi:hypothetical protein T265_07803 [Opisthorchis viverrini]|uniref:Uncharacterized protein n=1 Tax=Opisthorchis viverrini TaxID=6198 RepID=A0A074ZFV8_OPIVI|nr:hypothetical protein T265_07803 [Opisthorchis viverrini]KER24532.1 hypothetical protein T265_07803 [Opisthorchis viverrini]